MAAHIETKKPDRLNKQRQAILDELLLVNQQIVKLDKQLTRLEQQLAAVTATQRRAA